MDEERLARRSEAHGRRERRLPLSAHVGERDAASGARRPPGTRRGRRERWRSWLPGRGCDVFAGQDHSISPRSRRPRSRREDAWARATARSSAASRGGRRRSASRRPFACALPARRRTSAMSSARSCAWPAASWKSASSGTSCPGARHQVVGELEAVAQVAGDDARRVKACRAGRSGIAQPLRRAPEAAPDRFRELLFGESVRGAGERVVEPREREVASRERPAQPREKRARPFRGGPGIAFLRETSGEAHGHGPAAGILPKAREEERSRHVLRPPHGERASKVACGSPQRLPGSLSGNVSRQARERGDPSKRDAQVVERLALGRARHAREERVQAWRAVPRARRPFARGVCGGEDTSAPGLFLSPGEERDRVGRRVVFEELSRAAPVEEGLEELARRPRSAGARRGGRAPPPRRGACRDPSRARG